MHFLDYGDFVSGVLARLEAERADRNARRVAVKRKSCVFTEKPPSEVVYGDGALRRLEAMLDSFPGYARSATQKRFHRAFTGALLPHIYGSDFERHRTRVLENYGLTRVDYEVLVVCPRRFGKTVGTSMWLAACLLCIRDFWGSVFSTGQRASTMLLDQARRARRARRGA